MTDQGATLKLARAVYPNEKWILTDGEVITSCAWVSFDPATNDTQAVAVLCWLITAANCNAFRHGTVELRPTALVIGVSVMGDESRASYFDYDNTPASFRAAVTKAALRVVGGST